MDIRDAITIPSSVAGEEETLWLALEKQSRASTPEEGKTLFSVG